MESQEGNETTHQEAPNKEDRRGKDKENQPSSGGDPHPSNVPSNPSTGNSTNYEEENQEKYESDPKLEITQPTTTRKFE